MNTAAELLVRKSVGLGDRTGDSPLSGAELLTTHTTTGPLYMTNV